MAEPTPIPEATSSPDWAQIDEGIVCECPLCGYNLRGLIKPRCPECGYRFDWNEMLDPNRRLHPYLFEHHPKNRPWSFCRTLVGGLLPRRFWRTLHPAQPSYPRRLAFYGLLVGAIYLLSLIAQASLYAVSYVSGIQAIRLTRVQADRTRLVSALSASDKRSELARREVLPYGSVEAYLAARYPPYTRAQLTRGLLDLEQWQLYFFIAMLWPLVWPWLVLFGLLVFRISMRRARIRPIHVWRCIVYSYDMTLWIGLMLLAVMLLIVLVSRPEPNQVIFRMESAAPQLFLVGLLVTFYRLGTAYRLYLRFDHPFSTVLAAHVIALLLLCNLVSLYGNFAFG